MGYRTGTLRTGALRTGAHRTAAHRTWARSSCVVAPATAFVFLLVAACGFAASPAAAQTATSTDVQFVVDIVDFDGYYVATNEDINRFEDLIDRANETGDNWYFVVLDEEPVGGPSVYAGQLQELLPDSGTVVVINPYDADGETRFESGIDSADYDSVALSAGDDYAVDLLGGTNPGPIDIAEATFDGIRQQSRVDPPSGGPSAAWLLLPVGVGGAAWAGNRWYQGRRTEQRDIDDMDTARKEIKQQLDAVANHVVSQQAFVELSSNEQAKQYYAEATATYTEVDDQLVRADDLVELAELNDKIDLARWQMEAAEALIDGQEVPPKPTPDNPVACFFDPTHRPSTKLVTIKTAAGDKQVRVCDIDAAKLERGERPNPRMIDVHGRRLPAAKAPRSHGGLGMGGIDFFDILLGGGAMGSPRTGRSRRRPAGSSSGPGWNWNNGNTTRPKPRNRGGVFGPDRVPRTRQRTGAPGRARSTTRPTRRSTSRPRRRTTGKRRSQGRSRKRF